MNRKFLFLFLFLIILFFSSCNLTNINSNSEIEIEERNIESPIDLEFELKGNINDLEYLDNLELLIKLKNNADYSLEFFYQIGYNYLDFLNKEDNKEKDILETNEKVYNSYYFQVESLDYNLESINLDYYYCYNYKYNYDLYLEMYDENGNFLEDNIIENSLSDIVSDVLIDKVEVKYRNEDYFIEIYFSKNLRNDEDDIVLSVDDKCNFNYSLKDQVYYNVKINNEELDCYYNLVSDDINKIDFQFEENPKIVCKYNNPQKISLNLDLFLEYGYLGEFQNRLGVRVE